MKKFNLEAFKRDEVALKNLSNVQGGSGAGSSTMVFYTYCIPSDSDSAFLINIFGCWEDFCLYLYKVWDKKK